MKRYAPSSRRKAFTLIELLVVVAIISLLVSILLPSLTKAKDLAKDVMCLNNLKQIALATRMYADDNQEQMPCYAPNANLWFFVLTKQLGGGEGIDYLSVNSDARQGVLYCPAEPDLSGAFYGVTYAMNTWTMGQKIEESIGPIEKLVYLLDSKPDCPSINTWTGGSFSTWEVEHDPSYRHYEGLNILFKDLHVQRMDEVLFYFWTPDPQLDYCWH